jgi:hypothetical protein
MSDDPFRDFLRRVDPSSHPALPAVYHAVRNIPYGSIGRRDPAHVLVANAGSCSAKHMLLDELLRRLGHRTRLITIFTHFDEGVPDHASYPEELRELLRRGKVPDFHHFLRVEQNGRWLDLDATWHDRLGAYGFPVNAGWTGAGDTRLAARPIREYPPTDDLVALKERLLKELSPPQRALRTRFFGLLSDWIAGLPEPGQ